MSRSPYAELHAHSHFSLLDGASSPDALVGRAAELGIPALALTDHDALYGAVEFARAAEAAGVRPIFGAELTLEGDEHLTLLVANETGWAQLITAAQAHAPKGEAALPVASLEGPTGATGTVSHSHSWPSVLGHGRSDRVAALAGLDGYHGRVPAPHSTGAIPAAHRAYTQHGITGILDADPALAASRSSPLRVQHVKCALTTRHLALPSLF